MGFFKKLFKGIKKVFKKIGKGIKKIAGKVGKVFGKLGIVGTIALAFLAPYALGAISTWAGGLAASSNAFVAGFGKMVGAATKFIGGIGNAIQGVSEAVTSTVSNIVGKVGGEFLQKMGIDTFMGKDLTNLASWGDIWSQTQSSFAGIKKAFTEGVAKQASLFETGRLGDVLKAPTDKFVKLGETGGTINVDAGKVQLDSPINPNVDIGKLPSSFDTSNLSSSFDISNVGGSKFQVPTGADLFSQSSEQMFTIPSPINPDLNIGEYASNLPDAVNVDLPSPFETPAERFSRLGETGGTIDVDATKNVSLLTVPEQTLQGKGLAPQAKKGGVLNDIGGRIKDRAVAGIGDWAYDAITGSTGDDPYGLGGNSMQLFAEDRITGAEQLPAFGIAMSNPVSDWAQMIAEAQRIPTAFRVNYGQNQIPAVS